MQQSIRFTVKAKTGAKEESVTVIDATTLVVSVKERPLEGRANARIVKLLAKHFRVSTSHVRLVSGATSKTKVVEIHLA